MIEWLSPLTKCIECPQAALQPGLLPERILVQVMFGIPIHYESGVQTIHDMNEKEKRPQNP